MLDNNAVGILKQCLPLAYRLGNPALKLQLTGQDRQTLDSFAQLRSSVSTEELKLLARHANLSSADLGMLVMAASGFGVR